MNYTVIDFETANEYRGSACALGVVKVSNGEVIFAKEWLIKPRELRFNEFNTYIHGISEANVLDKPEFDELYFSEIKEHLVNSNFVIAHNASFDIGVLRHLFHDYNIQFPEFNYLCTLKLAQKNWPNLINYRLNTISDMLNFEFVHHNPLADCVACVNTFETILKDQKVNTPEELLEKFNMQIGIMFAEGYKPCSFSNDRRQRLDAKAIIATNTDFDIEHPFYDKKIIFTGTLSSMERREAMQLVVNLGAEIGKSVTKDTDFLVVGEQDIRRLNGKSMSSKMVKAIKYNEEGLPIQIISENDFVRML